MQSKYNIIGIVSENQNEIGNRIEDVYVVTHLENLKEFCRLENISQIIFSSHNIAYEKILRKMAELNQLNIEFKIIPENMDMVIGKSSIEKFDEIPLIEMDYAYGRTFNKIVKRIFDICVSFVTAFSLLPFFIILFIFNVKKIKRYTIHTINLKNIRIFQVGIKPLKGFVNFWLLNFYVLKGSLSIVGAPIILNTEGKSNLIYKPGITGLIQLNKDKSLEESEIKKYEIYYLKNHNLWLDLEIIFRSIFFK